MSSIKLDTDDLQVAIDKAFTAAGHRVGTHMYKDAVWPGGAAYGLGNTNGGRFTTFGGGLPILNAKGGYWGNWGQYGDAGAGSAGCAGGG
jgi:uncharacterized protein GlcG (DUF336 family)